MAGVGTSLATRMAPSGASSTSGLVMLHARSPTHATTAMTTSSTGPASSAEPYSTSAGGSAGEQNELKLSSYNPWTPQVCVVGNAAAASHLHKEWGGSDTPVH
eukprot:GHRQ01026773.1.p3 GENE.GHRQ01026773.1~~GHRQ01026773.1.p3  ORF type:complete len:111 (-),score=47.32 GHRQ01026773.1:790-1098(-)